MYSRFSQKDNQRISGREITEVNIICLSKLFWFWICKSLELYYWDEHYSSQASSCVLCMGGAYPGRDNVIQDRNVSLWDNGYESLCIDLQWFPSKGISGGNACQKNSVSLEHNSPFGFSLICRNSFSRCLRLRLREKLILLIYLRKKQ